MTMAKDLDGCFPATILLQSASKYMTEDWSPHIHHFKKNLVIWIGAKETRLGLRVEGLQDQRNGGRAETQRLCPEIRLPAPES